MQTSLGLKNKNKKKKKTRLPSLFPTTKSQGEGEGVIRRVVLKYGNIVLKEAVKRFSSFNSFFQLKSSVLNKNSQISYYRRSPL